MDLQCGKQRQMVKGDVFFLYYVLLDWPHTHTRTHGTMCVEKKSLRRIMYATARSSKPRVSVHLVFNYYKLSHLTPSSLPSTTGLERSLHTRRPDSKLNTSVSFETFSEGIHTGIKSEWRISYHKRSLET